MNPQTEIDFYSTTSDTAEQRFREKVRATSQTNNVYELMRDGIPRTSMEVSRRLNMNLNSARRSLTDLCRKFELLVKTDLKVMESDGANNHYYQLSK